MAGRGHRIRELPHRLHPAVVEDHVAVNHRQLQSLLVDNQRLAATHVALKQELSAAKQELHHLSTTADAVKAESDDQVRELYEKSLKVEAKHRSIAYLSSELEQVRADIQKLSSERKELTSKLQAVQSKRALSELPQLPAVKAEIEVMHQEIQRGRAAIKYEKQMHTNNLEIRQAMEKNMSSMTQEIEKLRAELANAEKRARAAAAASAAENFSPGYAAGYGNPEVGYGANAYPDPYKMHQGGPRYGPGAVPTGLYDMQQPHVP